MSMREYPRLGSVVFRKTRERFGGLSNMAPGFPLAVGGVKVRTAEALYQLCRFPHHPEVQASILQQISPMTAKMKSRKYLHKSRPDWMRVRVQVMRWSLEVKLCQNWDAFSQLLLATVGRPIVEESRKDEFWGAKPVNDGALRGTNALGRLLMELRERILEDGRDPFLRIHPLEIPNFLLLERPIGAVYYDRSVEGERGHRGDKVAWMQVDFWSDKGDI